MGPRVAVFLFSAFVLSRPDWGGLGDFVFSEPDQLWLVLTTAESLALLLKWTELSKLVS